MIREDNIRKEKRVEEKKRNASRREEVKSKVQYRREDKIRKEMRKEEMKDLRKKSYDIRLEIYNKRYETEIGETHKLRQQSPRTFFFDLQRL